MKMEKSNRINKAPLPFQGQKRHFVKDFREVIKNNFDDSYIFVDLFGGSGLLSANVKDVFPNARVVYNDFDNFTKRCEKVEETNEIILEIGKILKDVKKHEKINEGLATKITNLLEKYEKKGYDIDCLTISKTLLFTGGFCLTLQELKGKTFYNRMRKSLFNEELVKNFHKGLEVSKLDYKENIEKFKNEKVCFLVDPPYMNTDVKTYTRMDYWSLKEYLDVNSLLKGSEFIFFTSSKSGLIELDKWLKKENLEGFFSKDFFAVEKKGTAGSGIRYTDYMILSK